MRRGWLLLAQGNTAIFPEGYLWLERLSLLLGAFLLLVLGHRRVWTWARETRALETENARLHTFYGAEISRLHSYYGGELARERARSERLEELLFRYTGIVTETLPRVQRALQSATEGK